MQSRRALELIFLETGIPYTRYLVDSEDPKKNTTDLYEALSSELTTPGLSSQLPIMRVMGTWITPSASQQGGVVDALLASADQLDPSFSQIQRLRSGIPPH